MFDEDSFIQDRIDYPTNILDIFVLGPSNSHYEPIIPNIDPRHNLFYDVENPTDVDGEV